MMEGHYGQDEDYVQPTFARSQVSFISRWRQSSATVSSQLSDPRITRLGNTDTCSITHWLLVLGVLNLCICTFLAYKIENMNDYHHRLLQQVHDLQLKYDLAELKGRSQSEPNTKPPAQPDESNSHLFNRIWNSEIFDTKANTPALSKTLETIVIYSNDNMAKDFSLESLLHTLNDMESSKIYSIPYFISGNWSSPTASKLSVLATFVWRRDKVEDSLKDKVEILRRESRHVIIMAFRIGNQCDSFKNLIAPDYSYVELEHDGRKNVVIDFIFDVKHGIVDCQHNNEQKAKLLDIVNRMLK